VAGLLLAGCTSAEDPEPTASPSAYNSTLTVRESLPGSTLGCVSARPDKGHLRRVTASFDDTSGTATFDLGPEMAEVSQFSLHFDVQLPPEEFHQAWFDIKDGVAAPAPPSEAAQSLMPGAAFVPLSGVSVTSISPTTVVVALDGAVLDIMGSADGFGIHGGVLVNSTPYECRRGVLSSGGS
jgi:hypothetical protein